VSGIVGLFNLDGRPADGRLAARMLDAIATRGPDASRVWTDDAVALGHCLLATLPESVGEVQPHAATDGSLAVAFDGRIDNRRELTEEFARARIAIEAPFDAAFALAAYRRWGVDCAARLLGDFAFAIWDRAHRRLFCARDVMAQKPFYYHHRGQLFLFASEPQALLRHPAVTRRPNEGMVAECLSIITSDADTLYADLQRLPRAGRIVVSPGGLCRDTYWTIDTARTIRYRGVDQYAEHLRDLLGQVVGDRLRCQTNTGVMLSGGVDSSSVMATAVRLERAGNGDTRCDAYSLIDPSGVLDEKAFIDRAVERIGCVPHQFEPSTFPASAYRLATRQRADLPSSPNARLMNGLRDGARQHGVRVLLSGIGSDEWLGGSFYHCTDLFRGLRWIALASYLRSLAPYPDFELPKPTIKVMTWPLLSRSMRKRIKGLIGRDGVPPWIRPEFARRVGLADRLYPLVKEPRFPTIAQRSTYLDMTSGGMTHFIEDEERSAAECGLEIRYPYADRRMMEFGLAIPEEMRWRGGLRKWLLREAMRGELPDEVRLRRISPNAGSVFVPTLFELLDEGLLREPAVERAGWVVGGEARGFFDRMLARQAGGDPDYTDDVWPMWLIVAVELWMRDVADRESADEGERPCETRAAQTSAV
jgi:asparagine synthase (glutamine-hydrolysing)